MHQGLLGKRNDSEAKIAMVMCQTDVPCQAFPAGGEHMGCFHCTHAFPGRIPSPWLDLVGSVMPACCCLPCRSEPQRIKRQGTNGSAEDALSRYLMNARQSSVHFF